MPVDVRGLDPELPGSAGDAHDAAGEFDGVYGALEATVTTHPSALSRDDTSLSRSVAALAAIDIHALPQ